MGVDPFSFIHAFRQIVVMGLSIGCGGGVVFLQYDFPSLFSVFFGQPPCLTWIMGHSYVFWGAMRAVVQPDGCELGFNREEVLIQWLGK